MDTDGKVRFPDPTENGSEFLFRRMVQQKRLRASASLRENRLFLLSLFYPNIPEPFSRRGAGTQRTFWFSHGNGTIPAKRLHKYDEVDG